ncbi:MAG TPA: phosphoglycerate kinase [Alphaproteobacteria bacterium]|nr:phosphoglycerate kinase [Alphaproteobacteria bacterium]
MPDFLTLDDMPLSGKIVLLRADLNVPVENGRVADATRIERLLPTLNELREKGAKTILLSHFGRPKGKPDPQCSLRPVAAEMENMLGRKVGFAEDCIGPKAETAARALQAGEFLLLENTRFHEGEEKNDPEFAKSLAALGEIFIDDAFSVAHRAHASNVGLCKLLPAAAGRLMQEELETLHKALEKPERPLAAVIGGSKISTKLGLLNNLLGKVDILILGGGMANTFLAAKGISVGKSLCEPDMFSSAQGIAARAEGQDRHIVLPKDVVVAAELKAGVPAQTVPATAVPNGQMILDLGPASVKDINDTLEMCKTVVWNGPLGAFEIPPFDRATTEVAICVADLTKRGRVLSVAGGGDTMAALSHAGVTNGFSYISSGGGAFLEWLEGAELPGVKALKEAVPRGKTGKVIM